MGNFWIAVIDECVIGTISLADIGNQQVALRKMFVKNEFRGKPMYIGQELMDTAVSWCHEKGIKQIFLGTVPHYYAAHRFYQKNGFIRLEKHQLPTAFHLVEVDKLFYFKNL
jgi:N-acetylglutamate synthase-like GNAT family acetyltransferase